MTWIPSPEVESHARLEITQLRDDVLAAQQEAAQRLVYSHNAKGTLRSTQFLADAGTDIETRLLAFGGDLVTRCIEIARLNGAKTANEMESWVNQLFEAHFVVTAMSAVDSVKNMKAVDGITEAWNPTNDIVFRARRDKDIEIGRLKLQDAPPSGLASKFVSFRELGNAMALETRVDELLAAGSLVSVLNIDLDGFKQVNDTKGHDGGNRCLEAVARVLQESLAGKGTLYRQGGDEFAAVLPNFDLNEAVATGERCRREIEIARVGGELPVTTSIGAAQPGETSTGKSLLKAADDAMYDAKRKGKNCVTRAAGGPPGVELERDATLSDVEIAWSRKEQGLHLRVTNHSPETMTGFKVFLVAAHRWSGKAWSESKDLATFSEIPLNGSGSLFADEPELFHGLFLGTDHLWFGSAGDKKHVRTLGRWRFTFRMRDENGRTSERTMCCNWDRSSQVPKPIDCDLKRVN